MITAIEIENFKAIRDRVRVELKPITLLFGPNSAGKSTILHALHYAREVFERHNLDADRTIAGGNFIDLGGFRNFVHGRDLARTVVLRFELDLKDRDLPVYAGPEGSLSRAAHEQWDVSSRVHSASVEVEIRWSEVRQSLYVGRYSVAINGEPLASLVSRFDGHEVSLQRKLLHPVWSVHELDDSGGFAQNPSTPDTCLVGGQADALPVWGRSLRLVEPSAEGPPEDEDRKEEAIGKELIAAEISQLVVGPGELFCEALRDYRYVGPLRETLARNFEPPRFPDPSRWANGAAAWDRLFTDRALVKLASARLSGPDSLEVGYQLRLNEYKEIPVDSPLMVLLRSGRAVNDLDDVRRMLDEYATRSTVTLVEEGTGIEVLPQDVGVGISQLIPVVVLALDQTSALAAVEQPELHVHPAIQVRLGDLFIQQVTAAPSRRFLLETHSEHLMLRLLRRIRETTENDLPPGHPGLKPDQVAVYYVESQEDGKGEALPLRVTPLQINESGEFVDRWPRGFFDERGEELF